MRKKRLIKSFAFIIVFVLLFTSVQHALKPYDTLNYQHVAGFYEEDEGTLDAVYIGSSNCFIFWNSAVAWKEHGITVYPYACNSLSFYATEHLIREARKTQPDATFIVNINAIYGGGIGVDQMYNLLNCMPFSLNKLALIDYMTDVAGYSFSESIEYYLPVIRYHERYLSISNNAFDIEMNGLKGATVFDKYFDTVTDVTDNYTVTEEQTELDEKVIECLDSLFAYIEEEDINVLFVTVPQAKNSIVDAGRYNTVNKYISEHGFDTLDLLSCPEELGLDLTTDFYNDGHVNIHGSIKFTNYLSEYLIENYEGFEDKRGDESYSDWDESLAEYTDIVSEYILDFETDTASRDLTLHAPAELSVTQSDGVVSASWAKVDGADGYAVYRKAEGGPWQSLCTVGETEFNEEITESGVYSYTVVPYRDNNGEVSYGNYDYLGISVECGIPAETESGK